MPCHMLPPSGISNVEEAARPETCQVVTGWLAVGLCLQKFRPMPQMLGVQQPAAQLPVQCLLEAVVHVVLLVATCWNCDSIAVARVVLPC